MSRLVSYSLSGSLERSCCIKPCWTNEHTEGICSSRQVVVECTRGRVGGMGSRPCHGSGVLDAACAVLFSWGKVRLMAGIDALLS